jgi:tetratricopeptide (TPR) repeat protein
MNQCQNQTHSSATKQATMSFPRVSAASPHLVPERLNDLGADLIEAGQYDEAIEALLEGLQVIRQRRQLPQNTTIYQCSFAECMKFSQESTSKTLECCEDDDDVDDDDDDVGNIFCQPIRIPVVHDIQTHDRSIADFTLLSLVFAFNLALAHQLSATEGQHRQVCPRRRLGQAMQLYQLAFKWHLEEQRNKRIDDSLHFAMVIVNNLGEIHRVLKNKSKYVRCLEHVLSGVMHLVDYRGTRTNQKDSYSIHLGGFLKNTAKIILQRNCANAA